MATFHHSETACQHFGDSCSGCRIPSQSSFPQPTSLSHLTKPIPQKPFHYLVIFTYLKLTVTSTVTAKFEEVHMKYKLAISKLIGMIMIWTN